jgi:hypothetical protein
LVEEGMRNQTLYESYRNLCLKSFDLLSKHFGDNELDLSKFIWKYVFRLSEYDSFLENLNNDLEFSKHFGSGMLIGTFLQTWSSDPKFFFHIVLTEIIRNKQYDLALVESIYTDLENVVYSNTIPVKAIFPLDNLDAQSDCINLEEGVSIRRITDEEKENLKRLIDGDGEIRVIISSRKLENWRYVIEIRYNAPKILINTREQGIPALQWPDKFSSDGISNLFIPLRIFKSGSVGCRLFLARNELNLPFNSIKKFDIEITRERGQNPRKYFLEENQVSDFQKFYHTIRLVEYGKKHRPLDVVIRRFDYSYERRRSEDKIIDYAISMEALFSSGSKDSFTHKLRIRCARLIEDDFNERMKISENVKDFYTIRSKIVHDGETFNDKDRPLMDKIEDYLRISIRKAIEKDKCIKDMNDELDLS